MTDNALLMDATNTTDGPVQASAAPVEAVQPATANAAPQQQQSTQGSDSAAATNPAATEQSEGAQEVDSANQTAPESYEFKAPDGVVIDDTTISAFSDVAKELNLPQADAQKLIDKVGPVMAKQQAEALNQLNTSWIEGVQADTEIGGAKLQENLAVANKAMERFGTPALRELLNESRLGNNPEVIRFMYRAGKAISEDKFVAGGPASPSGSRDPAKFLYPNQTN
jgi:hypothetical protein